MDFLLENRRGASAVEMHRFRFGLGAGPGRYGRMRMVGFAGADFDVGFGVVVVCIVFCA